MTFSERAIRYADGVIGGSIPACEYVKQACTRFIKDLNRAAKKGGIDFDQDEAEKWCRNLEKLPHVKGKWIGKSFELADYQIFCTVNIFGFMVNGKRRFRDAYIEVPRKNGKSFWVAGIGIGMLTWEEEPGAEVYCGATTEEQAWYVFKPAKLICEKTPKLKKKYGVNINAKTITILNNGSVFRPIIGDPGDGASPSCAITDEYHEHKDSDQVDTMETGMGAREQPLGLKITTAGSDTGGPCYAKRDDVIKILSGAVEDDTIFGIIYTIDESDQWDTIEAQKKANPNYGISVDAGFLEAQLNQARRSAVKQVAYKTKYLNQWVGAKAAWMNMLAYQACRKKKLNIEDFKGRRCYVAIDLSSKIDVSSMAILFPPENGGKFAVFLKHYLPEETILDGGHTRYKAWHASGHLTATPGNVIDYEYIEDDLKELKSNHEIIEVPYDPFQATQFSVRMLAEGFPMVELGATVKNFSEPMKELEALILKKHIDFELDPVLMWMFGNVVAKLDKKDNIFPNKERYENKIDGPVALIMALARWIQNNETPSVYETRGIRTL
ncbi:MAG: terminase TerL endonuclease subunit [Desulfobacterales bacterium]